MKYDLEDAIAELHHLSCLECAGRNFDVLTYTIDSRFEDMDEELVRMTEEVTVACEGYTARIFVVRT